MSEKQSGVNNSNYKHGGKGTRLYSIWKDIKKRCENPKSISYPWYGAKGIKRCKEWSDFNEFRNWSYDNGYSDILTIDRINNEIDYCPSNCRWVTKEFQNSNTGSNTFFFIDGVRMTMAEVARKYNITPSKLSARVTKLKWPIERAILNTETKRGSNKNKIINGKV